MAVWERFTSFLQSTSLEQGISILFDTPSTVWVSLPIVGSLLAFFLKILRKKLTDRSFADHLGK
jgi:hypothetical protein